MAHGTFRSKINGIWDSQTPPSGVSTLGLGILTGARIGKMINNLNIFKTNESDKRNE